MNTFSSVLAAGLFATSAFAQACIDPAYGTSLGSTNDTVHPAQPIGFAFPVHDGTALNTFTDIHISDHGVVWLSNAGTPTPPAGGATTYNVLLSDFVLYGPCIAAFWADANCGYNVSPLGEVWINNTDPTKCVVTWTNIYTYFDQLPAYTFQLTLHVTGEVTMVWDANTNNYGSTFAPNAIVGVTPGSGALLPAPTDLSAAAAPTTDPSIFEEFTTPSTFDMAADGINLIPTNPGWVVVPLGGQTNCASKMTFGTGCLNSPADFHELLPAGAFDLGGTTITMLRTGNGYTSLDTIPGAIVPPGPNAVDVALGDDIEETFMLSQPMPGPGGVVTDLTVCSNGRIAFGATGNGTGFTPDENAWLAFTVPEIAVCWHDFQPNAAGSGTIKREEVNGIVYVTWDGVYSWGQTVGDTFQAQFNLNTGDITLVYDANWSNLGNDYLVGALGFGPIVNGNAHDLSVDLGGSIDHFDNEILPLSLDSNAPSLGNNWDLTTSNVDPISPIAITFFSSAAGPGLPVTAIGINAPGCSAWLGGSILSALSTPVVGGTGTLTVPVPNNTGIIGTVLVGQSICLTLANPANLLFSNGLQGTVGY